MKNKNDMVHWLIAFLQMMLVIFVIIAIVLFLLCIDVFAEGCVSKAWVICKEDDYINIRSKPTTKSEVIGYIECGDSFDTDWETKNGWIHAVNLTLERDDGWIYTGFVVYDEPIKMEEEWKICANGRVACRRWVDGPRRSWIKPKTIVTVRYYSREWCITNRGYIKTKYLIQNEGEPK